MHLPVQKSTSKVLPALIFFLAFATFPVLTEAAALSLSPSSGTFETGQRVSLNIVASSNVPFNAISAVLSIPSSIFSIESVSKSGSVLNFWVTEPSILSGNSVKFEGVALGGFNGTSGTVVTIALRATHAGTGAVSFGSGQILANDGEGTDITGNLVGGNFTVKEATVKPTPTPTPTSVPEPSQPAPSLHAPEIMLGTKFGAQSIVGTSDYESSQVLVTFLSEDGVKIFIIGESKDDGSFNMLVPTSLKRGVYRVSAVVIKEDKTNSEPSNTITVQIGNIFSDVGIGVSILILLLILAIIYLILRTHHHITRKDRHDSINLVHKSFDLLREDLDDYGKVRLKKDITEAEKVITKEVKDIE